VCPSPGSGDSNIPGEMMMEHTVNQDGGELNPGEDSGGGSQDALAVRQSRVATCKTVG